MVVLRMEMTRSLGVARAVHLFHAGIGYIGDSQSQAMRWVRSFLLLREARVVRSERHTGPYNCYAGSIC